MVNRKKHVVVAIASSLIPLATAFVVPRLAFGFRVPESLHRPAADVDIRGAVDRSTATAPVADGAQRNAEFAMRQSVPDLEVRWSALTLAPSRLSGTQNALSPPSSSDAVTTARQFLSTRRSVLLLSAQDLASLHVQKSLRTAHNGAAHVTLQQRVGGIDVFQGVVKVNLDAEGRVWSVAGEPVRNAASATNAATPALTADQAIARAAEHAGVEAIRGSRSEGLVYFPLRADGLRLAWRVVVEDAESPNVYDSVVDALDGTVLWRANLTHYNHVLAHGAVYTTDSPNPNTPTGSSLGVIGRVDSDFDGLAFFPHDDPHDDWWNGSGQSDRNSTRSNNVVAKQDRDGDNDDGEGIVTTTNENFTFPVDLTMDPSTYPNAAVANLFYWNNRIHDEYYRLGFDEAAGNFQVDNFGLGGSGGDPVQADAQDNRDAPMNPSLCNANMSGSSTDGFSPRMQMYQCGFATPERDGDFDNQVIIHEYTHGVHFRLVPTLTGSQGGMGEGWGDFMGLAMLAEPTDDLNGSYEMGEWLFNFGIRRQPYSTDQSVFTRTYGDLPDGATCTVRVCSNNPAQTCNQDSDCGAGNVCSVTGCQFQQDCQPPNTTIPQGMCVAEVHDAGEIWANALWIARAHLVTKLGFDAGGLAIKRLVIDGMKMAAPMPDMLDMRDAILQADQLTNGGANRCLLWSAFARMGMGFSALSTGPNNINVLEAFDTPSGCTPNVKVGGSLEIGNVCVGESGTTNLTIHNTGTGELVVSDVRRTSGSFDISVDADPETPLSVAPGSSVDFAVRCTPGTSGLRFATITVESNDPDTPSLSVSASCDGGVPSIVLDPPDLSGTFAFPPTIQDPNGTLGCFSERHVTIRNNGTCPLRIDDVFAGPSSEFEVTAPTTFPVILEAGEETLDVTVRFSPTTGGGSETAPDESTGFLTVLSNDPNVFTDADLCGEAVVQSGLRLLVVENGGTPIHDVDVIRVHARGIRTPRQIRERIRNVPLSIATVCGNPIYYHINRETLPTVETTGAHASRFVFRVRDARRSSIKQTTFGHCDFKEVVFDLD